MAPAAAKTYKVVLGEYKTEAEADAAKDKIMVALEAARKQLTTAETLLEKSVVK